MKRKTADKICSQCPQPGYRFRGERWLCIIHHRIDTMKSGAKLKGKRVPSDAELLAMVRELIARGMTCEACQTVMQWAGVKGDSNTVSLQHDRSGRMRLICMLCNQRHDDLPGDTFYELPANSWRCPSCKQVLSLAYFNKKRGICKECRKALSKKYWALHGKRYMENSKRRKEASQCG